MKLYETFPDGTTDYESPTWPKYFCRAIGLFLLAFAVTHW